jgi:predicted aspartyl protease
MITGAVKADEARIRLTVRGHRGREQEVEAVIDTGYTGALTLPLALITLLGLRWHNGQHWPTEVRVFSRCMWAK